MSARTACRLVARAEAGGGAGELPHAGEADRQHADGHHGLQQPGRAEEDGTEDGKEPERRWRRRHDANADVTPPAQRQAPERSDRWDRGELADPWQAAEHDPTGTNEQDHGADKRADRDDAGGDAVVGDRPLGDVPGPRAIGGDVGPQCRTRS